MKRPISVHTSEGCVATLAHFEDAAAIAHLSGEGARVKWAHRWVIWSEGREEFCAGDSYDGAARVMIDRVESKQRAALAKVRGAE